MNIPLERVIIIIIIINVTMIIRIIIIIIIIAVLQISIQYSSFGVNSLRVQHVISPASPEIDLSKTIQWRAKTRDLKSSIAHQTWESDVPLEIRILVEAFNQNIGS